MRVVTILLCALRIGISSVWALAYLLLGFGRKVQWAGYIHAVGSLVFLLLCSTSSAKGDPVAAKPQKSSPAFLDSKRGDCRSANEIGPKIKKPQQLLFREVWIGCAFLFWTYYQEQAWILF